MRSIGKRKLKPLFAASSGKDALEAAPCFWMVHFEKSIGHKGFGNFPARLLGNSVPCGARPGTLSLDPAALKGRRTFYLRCAPVDVARRSRLKLLFPVQQKKRRRQQISAPAGRKLVLHKPAV